MDTREINEETEVKYLQKVNDDYTEYIVQFNVLGSFFSMNTNLPYEEARIMVDGYIEDLINGAGNN